MTDSEKYEMIGKLVESIASGIQDRDNSHSGLLAATSPTFSWVRLAPRIPVRIVIDDNPQEIRLIVGRTATVTVLDGQDAKNAL
ncbi:hypothetical protein LF599_14285 [Pseudodesulfovibrio thermohalotolerans]|uniref:hypothetical protein n=1 Tax=Pseudodesulfovibrio thermohalotolerans TaxID=2880651 RepID=UPI0022B9E9D4|nr:hypothetical protein [Pseudodesulfovibrio thermohalotolerans]WFS61829.1 hypothetical protein LF599_14285 [Pseudodesulfovibrio thermohalotolerans]